MKLIKKKFKVYLNKKIQNFIFLEIIKHNGNFLKVKPNRFMNFNKLISGQNMSKMHKLHGLVEEHKALIKTKDKNAFFNIVSNGLQRDIIENSILLFKMRGFFIKKGYGHRSELIFYKLIKLFKFSINLPFNYLLIFFIDNITPPVIILQKKRGTQLKITPYTVTPFKNYKRIFRSLVSNCSLLKLNIKKEYSLFKFFVLIIKGQQALLQKITEDKKLAAQNRPFGHYRWFAQKKKFLKLQNKLR
jgi:hypothetical protein